ncbi:hypothetical protein [Roseomonas elaeocarpi]|uniref:Uncharacterized protein n=1 Tax=Roseomonas elaeocarpi TaxID=907779 RepID=A0ABV6JX82_9PROT
MSDRADKSVPVSTTSNIIPEENAVSSATGPEGPYPLPRDKSPEHQYKPRPGDNNNRTDPDAPGGPVNIRVKGGGENQDQAPTDAGVDEHSRERATGMGKHGV